MRDALPLPRPAGLPPEVGALSRVLLPAVDRLVDARYPVAATAVRRLRAERPTASESEIVDALISTARRELVAVGAAAGGAAAVPGAGTGVGLAASTADIGWTVTRLGEMILSIGVALGHSGDSIEERRAWVLAVLGMASGASKGLRGLAGQVGSRGGARILDSIPPSAVARINRLLTKRFVARWGAQQGVLRLGRLVPFGIGAVIGGAGNAALVAAVGREAKRFFDVTA